MSRYRCGGCSKEFESLQGLPKTLANPDSNNPERFGYHSVCPDCGHEFHKDDWKRQEMVKYRGDKFKVSTVFLHLNHGHGDKDLWYETMVFPETSKFSGDYQDRYETKEEAERGHERVVESIEKGYYYENEYGSLGIDTDRCIECGGTLLYSEKREEYFCPFCNG